MPTDSRPITDIAETDGTVTMDDERYVLRFERHLAHPVARVWAALTEPEQLAEWLAETEIDLTEGGDVELRWLNTDEQGNKTVARGTITRLEPPYLLEIATDVHGLLCWHVRPDGDGALLTFTSTVMLAATWLPRALASWHTHLDFLADALDGSPMDWPNWSWARWEALRVAYAAPIGQREYALAAAM